MNISNNDVGKLALPEGWSAPGGLWDRIYKHVDGREQKEDPSQPIGAIALANAIKNNGALEKLLMGNNKMASKEAGKALAEALKANLTLKELDVSGNTWEEWGETKGDGPGFAQELADGVKNNGAMVSVNILKNNINVFVSQSCHSHFYCVTISILYKIVRWVVRYIFRT